MSSSEDMKAQAKTVTPSTVDQTVVPNDEYNCLSQVTVNAIPCVGGVNAVRCVFSTFIFSLEIHLILVFPYPGYDCIRYYEPEMEASSI